MLGKVFWAGALAAMGDRDPRRGGAGVARAGPQGARPAQPHQLDGRRGRVRLLARRSSATSPTRRSRAPAVLQPPSTCGRLDRGRRRASGSRTWPTCSPTTTEAALELARAAGQSDQIAELQAQAVRYLALGGRAGARPRHRARPSRRWPARSSSARPTTPTAPARSSTGPQALQHQGRLQEARAALEEALDLYRAQGDTLGRRPNPDRAHLILAWLGDPARSHCATRSGCSRRFRPGRSSSPPTAARPASTRSRRAYPEAIAAADQALDLAHRARPARTRQRARAPRLARAAPRRPPWAGRDASGAPARHRPGPGRRSRHFLQQPRPSVWLYEGPQAELTSVAEGIDFCRASWPQECCRGHGRRRPSAWPSWADRARRLPRRRLADRHEASRRYRLHRAARPPTPPAHRTRQQRRRLPTPNRCSPPPATAANRK